MIECPKNLRTGPCGGVRGSKCEITGDICPFMLTVNKKGISMSLSNIHPVIRENEALIREDILPVVSKFYRLASERKALSIEFPVSLIHSLEDMKTILNATEKNVHLYTIPDNPLGYPHISSTSLDKVRLKSVNWLLTTFTGNPLTLGN